MWIVGGNIYNYFEEKEIKNNIIDLEHELYAIEIIKNFDISNISLTNRKAIIAKSVCATLEPKDSTISPAFVKQNFIQYFVSKGWHINENREKKKRICHFSKPDRFGNNNKDWDRESAIYTRRPHLVAGRPVRDVHPLGNLQHPRPRRMDAGI